MVNDDLEGIVPVFVIQKKNSPKSWTGYYMDNKSKIPIIIDGAKIVTIDPTTLKELGIDAINYPEEKPKIKQSGFTSEDFSKELQEMRKTAPPVTRAKFLHLRYRDPSPKKWLYFKRLKSGDYKASTTKKPGMRQFSTLDVGDLEEPGVQGIASVVGFLRKDFAIPEFSMDAATVYASGFKVQKIIVEQAAIGWQKGMSLAETETLIRKFYHDDILKLLMRDAGLSLSKASMSKKDFNIQRKPKAREVDFIIKLA